LKLFYAFLCALLGWSTPSEAIAQPTRRDAEVSEPTLLVDTTAQSRSAEAMRQQAERIRDLIAERLDVAVDPASLFAIDLSKPEASRQVESLLKELEQAPAARSRSTSAVRGELAKPSEAAVSAQAARDALIQAQRDFLSLPEAERQRLLDVHQKRRQAALAEAQAEAIKQQRLAELNSQAEQLEAFLEGKLDPSVDPKPLLTIDLSATGELALDAERRRQFVTGDSSKAPEDTATSELDSQLSLAASRLDVLRRRFLALDADAQAELFSRHQQRGLEAKSALEVQTQKPTDTALEANGKKQRASSEARMHLANRKAELLQVQERQARYADGLAQQRAELEQVLDSALGWHRKVEELEQSELDDRAAEQEADRLYSSLVLELTDARDELRGALDATGSTEQAVPEPPEADEVQLPAELGDEAKELRSFGLELQSEAARLRDAQRKLSWDRTSALRDAVVMINHSRLSLFDELSQKRRNDLSGFGSAGVQQAKRELDEIFLEGRYHLLALPRQLSDLSKGLRSSPGPLIALLFQVFLLVLVFRWWRKGADSVLEKQQRTWLQKRPQTELTRAVAGLLWYLRRVRKPLEWLLLLTALTELFGKRLGDFRELSYLRIVMLWVLFGAFVIRLIDAVADRQGYHSEFASKLRFRSLRLVGVTVVVVGLVLTLANASVGKGALYAWVSSTCWFLAIPIFVLLVYWWADSIFERAAAHEQSSLLKWALTHTEGFLRYPAAAIAGVYLLIQGIYGFSLNKAKELTLGRSILGYLSRRQVERQASGAGANVNTAPISPELREQLISGTAEGDELVTAYMAVQVHAMRALVRSDEAAIVAVVGEHGEGKTTFLRRVVSDLDGAEHVWIDCPLDGLAALRARLALAMGLEADAAPKQLLERLHERPPRVICIDDAHALIKPRIGGLRGIDGLVRLMRAAHPSTSWLVGISLPAWHYFHRARGQRTPFDQVIELKVWEPEQIATLLESRTRAAGISPSFEQLAVPQQFAGSRLPGAERTRRDFNRILADYSGGNAEVALYFWCEALHTRPPDSEICVRIPKVPSANELEEHPNGVYFVLRTILQLERASMSDIVRCTALEPAEVADALRVAEINGYVEERDRLFEIRVHWYPAVTNMLRRKHLMLL
jgi:hypothetical protein